jgi:hypothetical protein
VLGGEWFYGYGMQGLHGKDQTWLLAELRERDRQLAEAQEKAKHYYNACVKMEHEVTQVLGKALGYPEYGPEVFENGQPDGSVCVGEHVAESIADEAARRIKTLEEGIRSIECRRCANTGVVEHIQFATETSPTYRHRSPCPVCGKARVALKKEILGE